MVGVTGFRGGGYPGATDGKAVWEGAFHVVGMKTVKVEVLLVVGRFDMDRGADGA